MALTPQSGSLRVPPPGTPEARLFALVARARKNPDVVTNVRLDAAAEEAGLEPLRRGTKAERVAAYGDALQRLLQDTDQRPVIVESEVALPRPDETVEDEFESETLGSGGQAPSPPPPLPAKPRRNVAIRQVRDPNPVVTVIAVESGSWYCSPRRVKGNAGHPTQMLKSQAEFFVDRGLFRWPKKGELEE